MIGNEHNTQEELASYAMQGLPVEEAASIRAHLQNCVACRTEMAAVCSDLALLGIAVEQRPLPDGARQRFMDKIAASPAIKAPSTLAEVTSIGSKSASRGPRYWVPWGIAAALAVATVLLGVQNRTLNDDLQNELSLVTKLAAQASRAQQVLEVLTAPSAQRVSLSEGKTPAQPTARATYLPERGGLILLAANLKPLPDGKTYELWVIPANGTAPVPAGLFRPDAIGAATLVLPSLPSGIAAKAFGVTIEKASGSDVPTSPIILSGAATGI